MGARSFFIFPRQHARRHGISWVGPNIGSMNLSQLPRNREHPSRPDVKTCHFNVGYQLNSSSRYKAKSEDGRKFGSHEYRSEVGTATERHDSAEGGESWGRIRSKRCFISNDLNAGTIEVSRESGGFREPGNIEVGLYRSPNRRCGTRGTCQAGEGLGWGSQIRNNPYPEPRREDGNVIDTQKCKLSVSQLTSGNEPLAEGCFSSDSNRVSPVVPVGDDVIGDGVIGDVVIGDGVSGAAVCQIFGYGREHAGKSTRGKARDSWTTRA